MDTEAFEMRGDLSFDFETNSAVISDPSMFDDWVRQPINSQDEVRTKLRLTKYEITAGVHTLRFAEEFRVPKEPVYYDRQTTDFTNRVISSRSFNRAKSELFNIADRLIHWMNLSEEKDFFPFDMCIHLNGAPFPYGIGIYHNHRTGKYCHTNYLCVPSRINFGGASPLTAARILSNIEYTRRGGSPNVEVFDLGYPTFNLPHEGMKFNQYPHMYAVRVPRQINSNVIHDVFRHTPNRYRYDDIDSTVSAEAQRIADRYDIDAEYLRRYVQIFILSGYARNIISYNKYFVYRIDPACDIQYRKKLFDVMCWVCELYKLKLQEAADERSI